MFQNTIDKVVENKFPEIDKDQLYNNSSLINYLIYKTKSANKGAKARASYANIYALYVLIEDYINNGYHQNTKYEDYEGANYSDLFARQRQLPFGEKLQNHALNNRLNSEYEKLFPLEEKPPIIRDLSTNKYWINEHLLNIKINKTTINIAELVIAIIDEYINTKRQGFEEFIAKCEDILNKSDKKKLGFIQALLADNVDARIFEIVSFAILKEFYSTKFVWLGESQDLVEQKYLTLYKTGRTNANDGGIDYVMQPLGRFFQVTETTDVTKYFLDIEKVNRYPITFVVKSRKTKDELISEFKSNALTKLTVKKVVDNLINSIEEVININDLSDCIVDIIKRGNIEKVLQEIILQSKVEFNIN